MFDHPLRTLIQNTSRTQQFLSTIKNVAELSRGYSIRTFIAGTSDVRTTCI